MLTETNMPDDERDLSRPSPSLTFEDAVEIWLCHFSGALQHHIAARFGVNQGRVNDILKERKIPCSREEALRRLGRNKAG